MAMIIFLVVALLVAAGLVSLNIRAVSHRSDKSVQHTTQDNPGPQPLSETSVIAADRDETTDVHSEEDFDDSGKKGTMVAQMKEGSEQGARKMKDSDYRLALKKMQGTPQEELEADHKQVMNDDDFRNTLKEISKKQK
ncbi:hypothetical protein [Bacillus sp. V5-8f]|uniref:hypothetical protein n=1 Tax=Bacillus sp. V5-8f TaxID=2053044 RepID=UPI000C78883E|nr:hypothetical protein [Bacillus sp. V5-8f]PLT32225.1 hypothetical protein CUU64_19120 [Bacillus sp. V5-8f]